MGSYSDGSMKVVSANWLSSSTSVATINTSGMATGVAAGTSTITATSGSVVGSTTLTVNPVALVSIAVTPGTASVAPNGTQQYTATGTYANGTTQNITSSVTWSASPEASITSAGIATGIKPGATATIMASLGSAAPGTATLTITNPLVSVAVTPATKSIAATFTQPFTATGTYADGSTSIITPTVTWASSNTSVATVSNSPGTQGLATGVAPGNAMITATLGSITSPPATLTVTNATLKSIAVTPASASVELGYQQIYTATGTFSDGSTLDVTNSVTWTSSDTTKVAMNGNVATGVAVTSSPVTITATKSPGTPGTATLSVTTPVLTSIAITPTTYATDTTKLAQGTSRQYTATGTRSNGSTLNITGLATWTSSDTTVATVGLHTGLVRAAASVSMTASVTISVTYSGITQTAPLDVTNATPNSVTVTPVTATLPAGVIQIFTATATFSDSSTQDISASATWASSNTGVATVNSIGRALGVSSGTTTITATFGAPTPGTATLTVSPATLQSIVVTPTTTLLAPGSTVAYQAVGHYSDGTTQYLSSTWNSSNTSVVTISAGGIGTGNSAGSANITAVYRGVTSNNAGVVVSQFPLASIAVLPATATVPFGVSIPFTATGKFSDGSTQVLTTSVTWASSQSSIATISNATGTQGVATGVAPGQTTITAVFAGIVNQPPVTLNVTNATIVSVAVTPASSSANAGTQVPFTAKGTFSDGSVVDLTTQVAWSSSDVTVAAINNTGLANTVSPGSVTITAKFAQNGVQVSGTATLTVN